MNMTDVYKILNDGTVNKHTFALSAKQALIACIMQERFHNYNTWEYPCDITGYLTGDLSSWNSAKRAEEHDRVKHA